MKNPRKPSFRPSLEDRLARIPTDPALKPPPLPAELNDVDPTVLRAISSDVRTELRANSVEKAPPNVLKNDSDELLLVMAGRLRTLEQEVLVQKENSKAQEKFVRQLQRQLQEERSRAESSKVDQERVAKLEEDKEVLKIQATRLTRQNMCLKSLLQMNNIPFEEMGDDGFIAQPPAPPSEVASGNTPPAQLRRPMTEPQLKRSTVAPSPHPPSRPSLCDDNSPFNLKQCQANAENRNSEQKQERPFNMKVIMKNVKELNAGCGPTHEVERDMKSGRNIHKFHERKVINVLFYSDGLCLNDGPFRPYQWPAAQAVIQDLMDGYFPYEFKQNYPDGIPLCVIDKTTEKCPNRSSGNPVDDGKRPIGSVLADKGFKAVSKAAFLDRLPKSVVKNGQLVEVRSEVASLLGEKKKEAVSPIIVPTAALQEGRYRQMHDRNSPLDPTTASSAPNTHDSVGRNIATIQVKSPHPANTAEMCIFIVHLFYNQTVGDLRSTISRQLADRLKAAASGSSTGVVVPAFTLCAGFPMVTLANDCLTLEEAQLTPTATVHVRLY